MPKPKDLVELSYLSEAVSDMSFLGLMRLLESARTFNQKNGITPTSIVRPIQIGLNLYKKEKIEEDLLEVAEVGDEYDVDALLVKLSKEMRQAADNLEFDKIAHKYAPSIAKWNGITRAWERIISHLDMWALAHTSFAPFIKPKDQFLFYKVKFFSCSNFMKKIL